MGVPRLFQERWAIDQTFILTTIVPSDAPVFRSYEVRLAPDGRPGPLTPVRLPRCQWR